MLNPTSINPTVFFLGNSYLNDSLKYIHFHSPEGFLWNHNLRPGTNNVHSFYDEENREKISKGSVDLLVLQEYSQMAVTGNGEKHEFTDRQPEPITLDAYGRVSLDRLGPQDFYDGVGLFDQLAKEQGYKIALMTTWANKEGPLWGKRVGDYHYMQKCIDEIHYKVAQRYGCEIIPVGKVWQEVRKIDMITWEELYASDERHPSSLGAWLVGAVLIKYILGTSTENFRNDDDISDDETFDILRESIDRVF